MYPRVSFWIALPEADNWKCHVCQCESPELQAQEFLQECIKRILLINLQFIIQYNLQTWSNLYKIVSSGDLMLFCISKNYKFQGLYVRSFYVQSLNPQKVTLFKNKTSPI